MLGIITGYRLFINTAVEQLSNRMIIYLIYLLKLGDGENTLFLFNTSMYTLPSPLTTRMG